MGFAEVFIDIVWRLIANNWYSILLNSQASGFFHSTRGVKQRDPLSPAFFILSAEVLFRALNSLFENNDFRSYGMPKWSATLNHLAFADDTIIFTSADSRSLVLIMKVLYGYEQISGQLILKGKSSFYVYSKVSNVLIQQVENITGFSRGTFPFTYLGCPVTHSRKRKVDYNDLIKKLSNLQNVLSMICIKYLQDSSGTIVRKAEEGIGYHGLTCVCQKRKEEWAFRSLFDVSKFLCAKLWWKFRTTNTLWPNYMWIKYCKRHSPQNV
ncbi:uncharacterized protein LOC132619866 [Lycium barbarum]|uniref:uncharacterized protein LOC132619866 n=1 Tax=Lycium barbarum TaxID=112863 RepID=UPI00293EC166|nr:uncharacterized protein LOC132619866 [Lycium barbarum]